MGYSYDDKSKEQQKEAEFVKGAKKWALWVIVGLFGFMTLMGSCSVIPAGYRGVVYSKISGVQKSVMTEGFNWKVPFIQTANKFNCRTQKVSFLVEGASKDLQLVKVEVSLNYRVDPTKVSSLYQEVGRDYEQVVIAPAIAECVKAATAQFPVEQVIVNRPLLRESISNSLSEKLTRYYIVLENLNLTDIDFSEEFNKVVEEKQIEEQKIKTAEYMKRQAEQNKQATILDAEAQAEKQRLMKNQVTADIVALEWIKKWNGVLPTTSLGQNNVPMIKLDNK